MSKDELISSIENEVKYRLESLIPGAVVTTYTDLDSAPSRHGLNVKGDEWEIEIAIFAKP